MVFWENGALCPLGTFILTGKSIINAACLSINGAFDRLMRIHCINLSTSATRVRNEPDTRLSFRHTGDWWNCFVQLVHET